MYIVPKMANINVGALSTALATAIQQAANHLALSTTASTTTPMTIVTQPSSMATITVPSAGGGEISSNSTKYGC